MTAYRILTDRLVLRSFRPADAPGVLEAITESLDHLRAWLAWARHEPEPLAKKTQRLRRYRAGFDAGGDRVYGLFDPDERKVLGAVGLHRRVGAGAAEIGYWVHVSHTRQGLASEAAAAVVQVGFAHEGLRRIEIHCDPANVASAAIPRRLGFALQVAVEGCVNAPGVDPRPTMFWALERDRYPDTPAAQSRIKAYGPAGEALR